MVILAATGIGGCSTDSASTLVDGGDSSVVADANVDVWDLPDATDDLPVLPDATDDPPAPFDAADDLPDVKDDLPILADVRDDIEDARDVPMADASMRDAGTLDLENSVLQHHHHATRDGLYTQPSLSKAAARNMHRDVTFDGTLEGNVYAQPLYVEDGPGGMGAFYVVTENSSVFAFDERAGKPIWRKDLGPSATVTGAGCGNIFPLGITGTPVIDHARRAMYFDAVRGTGAGANPIKTHLIHALSIDDGSELPGWPVDVSTVQYQGRMFNPVVQNQRSALLIVGGILYVGYGGHGGDCGSYSGWVVGVPLDQPSAPKTWATTPMYAGGGIWGPGGLASDGVNIFATTGNMLGAPPWVGQEAILRFQAGPVFSGTEADYFTPSNFATLDSKDFDLAGSGPLLLDAPLVTPKALVVALGKNGVVYLVDRNHLGGVGKGNTLYNEGIASALVANAPIINAAAAFNSPRGTFFVFHVVKGGKGFVCPPGQAGNLVGLRFIGLPAIIQISYCLSGNGEGSPIITTIDGQNEGIAWAAGADGTQRLYGWDAETGDVIFAGGGLTDVMANVRAYTTPIAVHGRIFVGADAKLFAFSAP